MSIWLAKSFIIKRKYGKVSAFAKTLQGIEPQSKAMKIVAQTKTYFDMEHTISWKRELKKLNVVAPMLVMADLIAVGHDAIDAYVIAYPENQELPEKQNKGILDNILASAKFKKLLEDRKSRVKDGSAVPVKLEDIELIEGDEVAKEILRSAKSAPVGSKERAELFMRYDEIRNRNNAEPTEEATDNINFYFPIKCSSCPLLSGLNKMLEEKGDEKIPPAEMDSIIRESLRLSGKTVKQIHKAIHGTDPEKPKTTW